jgi:hypothetical protein
VRESLLAVVFIASPAFATAQPPTIASKTGFLVHAGMNGSVLSGNEIQRGSEAGSGGTITVGYGLTPRLTLMAGVSGAVVNAARDFWIRHVDVGVRYEVTGLQRPWVPYVELAYTRRTGRRDDVELIDGSGTTHAGDLEFSGTGMTTGVGLLAFLNLTFACDVSLKWTFGDLSDVKVGPADVSGLERHSQTTRINLGVTWFPRTF